MAKKKSNIQLLIMLALIAAIIAFMFWGCGNGAQKTTSEFDETTLVFAGDAAPDFTVEMFDGTKVKLSDLRGKVVLLNFWATWCPPCREELAQVETEIVERFSGRDFVFLPISRGEQREAVEAFLEQTGYTFPVGLDPEQKIYNLYANNFIPRNFLIGADGKVVLATMGYEPEEFFDLIEKIENTLE